MGMNRESGREPSAEANRAPRGFFSGVLVLSGSTILVKIIGLAYKIPMMKRLGAVGMGYFNSAYEIYAVLCVIATAGLPMALSLLVASHREANRMGDLRRTDRSAMLIFLLLGLLGGSVLFWGAKPISIAIGNPDAYFCILAISPALFMVCISSSVRGYFQGFQRMGPTAVSQLIEALGKLIFGVWFASIALKRGYSVPVVAAGAICGLTLGTLLSAAYLLVVKLFHKQQKDDAPASSTPVLRNLLRMSVPITLGAALLSMTKMIDMTLMMHRLQGIGYSLTETNAIYGSYTTLAVPVFSLIPSLITPIALVLVPKLSAAIERKDLETQATLTENSIRMTVILSMPASLGISAFSAPILSLLFAGEREAIGIAAPMLAILGGSVLFSGLITATNAVLQTYRHPMLPVFSMLGGVLVKGISAYVLLGLPTIGAYGAPISTLLCDVFVTVLNLRFLGKYVPNKEGQLGIFQLYGKPLLAACLSVLSAVLVYFFALPFCGSESVLLLIAIGFAGLIYGIMIFWMRILTPDDLALFSWGEKILKCRLLDKKKGK